METKPSFFARHEFFLRRLHSLCGLIPVGAYMVVHLLTNASVLDSPETFQRAVYQIHSLGNLLPVVEWLFIFLPILFHAIYGVVIIRGGAPNYAQYKTSSNIRYTLQRATGLVAFAFILVHVFHMHGWFHFDFWLNMIDGWGHQFRPYNAASTLGAAMSNVLVQLFYLIGVLACVFHLANGLWTMGITWGLWTTPQSQQRANRVCAGIGIVLGLVGLAAWWGARTVDVNDAFKRENTLYKKRVDSGTTPEDEHKRAESNPAGEDD